MTVLDEIVRPISVSTEDVGTDSRRTSALVGLAVGSAIASIAVAVIGFTALVTGTA